MVDKFHGKLPKEELKKFAREVNKKLVSSDYKNNRVEERIVTVGETFGDRIEVTSGIAKSESVATDPKGRLADGQTVASR